MYKIWKYDNSSTSQNNLHSDSTDTDKGKPEQKAKGLLKLGKLGAVFEMNL